MSGVHKMVKEALKTFQHLLEDFWRVFDQFVDTRYYKFNFNLPYCLVFSVIFAAGPIPLSDLQVTLILYSVNGFKFENVW